MIQKINCQLELKQPEDAQETCSELLSLVKSINFEQAKAKQLSLDDYNSRVQKVVEKFSKTKSSEVALKLSFCRFHILKQHSKENTRLFKLANLSKVILPFAHEMKKNNQENIFKHYYFNLDEILQEIYKINEVDVKNKAKQVAWYLTHYGLCSKAIRDLPKSIDLNKQAITIMEFVFGQGAGKHKVYGHCHCNNGSAYELQQQLDEAKTSYENAIKAYKMVEGWKNDEKETTLTNAQKYLQRVCDKLEQQDD